MLILAVNQDRVKRLTEYTCCSRVRIAAVLRTDAEIRKNAAQHLHCFRVRTHHQGCKRHTRSMLGLSGKWRQVTAVTLSMLRLKKV